jgi:hypothetical protein
MSCLQLPVFQILRKDFFWCCFRLKKPSVSWDVCPDKTERFVCPITAGWVAQQIGAAAAAAAKLMIIGFSNVLTSSQCSVGFYSAVPILLVHLLATTHTSHLSTLQPLYCTSWKTIRWLSNISLTFIFVYCIFKSSVANFVTLFTCFTQCKVGRFCSLYFIKNSSYQKMCPARSVDLRKCIWAVID